MNRGRDEELPALLRDSHINRSAELHPDARLVLEQSTPPALRLVPPEDCDELENNWRENQCK